MGAVIRVCTAIAILGVSTVSLGENVFHTAKIQRVYPLSDGTFVLVLANDSEACPSSSSPKYYRVEIGKNGVTELGLKNMLSVSMFAAAADLNITIIFDDSSSGCYINRLQATLS